MSEVRAGYDASMTMPTTDAQYAIYPSLRERVVLVTGGGSGIGAAAVREFARQGARVTFLDRVVEPSEELVRELAGAVKFTPRFMECDLTDLDALAAAVARTNEEVGAPAVLINNAGNDDRHRFEEVSPAYWDQRMATNLKHQFFAAQAVTAGMKAARAGVIVNLSSIAWKIPSRELTVYNMAKAAVMGMTRSLAHELGEWGIRVNAILPGAILTERQRRLWLTPEYEAQIKDRQALQRHLMPEDVARLMLFLAADDSSGMTGQGYVIDGGWI